MTALRKTVGIRFENGDLERLRKIANIFGDDVSTYIRKEVVSHLDLIDKILSSNDPLETLYIAKESCYAILLQLKKIKEKNHKLPVS